MPLPSPVQDNVFACSLEELHIMEYGCPNQPITLVNTQNVSVTKIVDSSSIQCTETKYGLRIQFLALVVMICEVWLSA